jgi:hypothetical protein
MAAHKPSQAKEDIAIGDMFDIQFAINRLTQLADVIDAARPDHPASERASK